jgi:hypothetical protein
MATDDATTDRLHRREEMNLCGLSADELTARLKEHVEGPLVLDSEVEIARECVRRARRAEAAELAALETLDEMRSLIGQGESESVEAQADGSLRTVTPGRGYRPT